MISPETKKRRFKDIHKFTPSFTDRVSKITAPLIALCLLLIIIGCGGGGDDSGTTPTPQSSAKSITAFSLNGVVTINQTEKTIDVIMPSGTDVANLVATFTTTGASVEVGSTAQVSGTTANDFTLPVVYTVTAADATTQEYTVTVTVAGKSITAFSLIGVAGTINEAAKTIAVTLASGTDVTALVATFTTTGASVTVDSTIQVSGTTPNDFTNPVVYTVTAVDATTQGYTVTVTTEPVNQPATAIRVSMKPNNPSTIDPSIYCTKTLSITGSYFVTDPDGGSVVVMNWYDQPRNGTRVLKQSKTIILGSDVTSGTDTFYKPFHSGYTITFEAIADGVPSTPESHQIT